MKSIIIKTFVFLLLFSLTLSQYLETNQDSDYNDEGSRTLQQNGGPTLLSPDAQSKLKGFEPIYVSPDLEDILDQQQYNVYHEEVHGTILMPRVSFALNDDDQPIKNDEDYSGLGVDPKFYSRHKSQGCGPGCVRQGSGSNSANQVPLFPNPMYNPTIEEMIPFARIKETPDTYIVMADDPVLAVDSVPKCTKNANKGDDKAGKPRDSEGGATPGAEGGEGSTAAPEGGSTSAAEGEASSEAAGAESTTAGGSTTTEAGRRRRRRSVLFERK